MTTKSRIIGYRANGAPIYGIEGADGPNLEKLLATVNALDPDKRTAEEAAPTDEELAEARDGLVEALKGAVEGDRPDVTAARAIRKAIDDIDAETVTRAEALAAEKAEAAELLKGIEASEQDEETEEGEHDDQPEEEQPEVETETERKVAVAASLTEALKRSSQRRVERVTEPEPRDVMVRTLGPAQGVALAADAGIDDVADVFATYSSQVKRGGAVLVHLDREYPEDRQLGNISAENTRKIDAVASPRAITAAGGVCDPLPADFSHPICGDRGRPIFNANPIFRADRGGARFAPSATVADLESAITVWTSTTDADPGTATKACPTVDCEDEDSATVDAVVACLTVGNFQARFNPEFWRSRLDLLMVAHDRIAEQTLYAEIESNSTQVTYAGGSGTVVDVLEVLDKATAGLKSRHRLIGTGFTAILPEWLRAALRANLAGQAPAGSLDLFSVAEAQLNQFFASRMITPVWSPDVDEFGAQGAGALVDFPGGNVDVVLYPNGTWMTFDGGTLDLGTQITDSTLNATNDRQAFMETFEKAVQRGCESLSISVPVAEACICNGVVEGA